MIEGKYCEVVTIVDDSDLANLYLKEGWVILNVCTKMGYDVGYGYHSILLGLPEGKPSVHPKKPSPYGNLETPI